MNARQWKKVCKAAALEVERRRPGGYIFEPATGDETVYAPRNYEPPGRLGRGRVAKIERRYASPPRGTPVIWETSGYYEPEADCYTALEILHRIDDEDYWAALSQEELQRICEPTFFEQLDEAARAVFEVLQTPTQIEHATP